MENELVQQIVKYYENQRLLWDSKHPEYYNKNKREDQWREIAAKVNLSVKEIKKKMTSLLGSYRREKSREKKSTITGSGPDDVYKSKWFAYSWFYFLADKDIPNDTTDTIENVPSQQEMSEETPEVEAEATNELPESTPTTSRNSDSEVSLSKPKKKSRTGPANYDKLNNEMLQDAYAILKKTSSTPSDHYESFGYHVTSELRKYDDKTLPYVKRAILDVLFRADIGEFTPHNRSGYYTSSIESSVPSTPVPLASFPSVASPVSTLSYTEIGSNQSLPHYFSEANPELMQ